ncbi:MAG: hypothetical protein ACUVRO_09915 [Armatimonadota bacterium]
MRLAYRPIAKGTRDDIKRVIDLELQHIPEGGLAELKLEFKSRVPGFETEAKVLNWTLAKKGVAPWPGQTQIVFVDPKQPVWYVRWRRGVPWAAIIIGAIVLLGLLFIAMIAWSFAQVVPVKSIIEEYPWLVPVGMMIFGTAGLVFLYSWAKQAGIIGHMKGRVEREVTAAIRPAGGA